MVDCVDFSGQLAHFVGDHREAQAVFSGARRFDGRVQRQKVGLFGEVIDDFNDFADIVGAMTQHIDNFRRRLNGVVGAIQAVGGFFHGLNAGDHFFARSIGDIQQHLGGIGNALNRSDHLIDGR